MELEYKARWARVELDTNGELEDRIIVTEQCMNNKRHELEILLFICGLLKHLSIALMELECKAR